jgi:hypothetical protein
MIGSGEPGVSAAFKAPRAHSIVALDGHHPAAAIFAIEANFEFRLYAKCGGTLISKRICLPSGGVPPFVALST